MMKKSIILSLILILSMSFVQAQEQGFSRRQRQSPEEMAKTRAEVFQKEFNLSAEQRTQTEEVLLEGAKSSQEKLMALREEMSQSDSREGMREKMMAVMQENREAMEVKLKKIFSNEQWLAYEKWKEENTMNQRRGRRGNKLPK